MARKDSPTKLRDYGYPPFWMDRHEAARHLGYGSPRIIEELEHEGRLKGHQLTRNGDKRYKRTDLEALGADL
jgi:hypothetical protein